MCTVGVDGPEFKLQIFYNENPRFARFRCRGQDCWTTIYRERASLMDVVTGGNSNATVVAVSVLGDGRIV